jgi:DNA-binding MurR/RpiR family transcriptional regulator
MQDLVHRIEQRADALPPAERRIAEVVLADPTAVAFSTVAEIGRQAGTSGATVVRLAGRLGYAGWADLQDHVRRGVGQQLRPARERIREAARGDVLEATAAREAENVHRTLASADRAVFARAVDLLARARGVHVVAGTAEAGIGLLATDALDLLRPGVHAVSGPTVTVARQLAHTTTEDVVLAIDLRRYERWVLDALDVAVDRGPTIIAVTDSVLSPLARAAAATFVVAAEGAGPFDSHVGTLALLNALSSGVARQLRRPAAARLDRVERAWTDSRALADG